jgi:hypothetical protein
MERKPEEEPGRDNETWRVRVGVDLQAYRAEQQRLWGGVDELTLARHEAGVSPDEERARVEQAMRDHPALRESMEIARELSARDETSAVGDSQQKPRGERPWTKRADADRPETDSGKSR